MLNRKVIKQTRFSTISIEDLLHVNRPLVPLIEEQNSMSHPSNKAAIFLPR